MKKESLRRRLVAMLIKDEAAFTALRARLQAALTRAFASGCEAAFQRALAMLDGVDPARFDAAMEARLLGEIEREIGGEAMVRAMQGPVAALTDAVYRVGAAEAARPAGVDVRFDVKDERALEILARADLHWIGRHWDVFTRATITDALQAFFDEGGDYGQLAERLRGAFDGVEERSQAYWALTADTIASKTREMGRIKGYEEAGVDYVQVRAHLDEATTAVCRSLHGRLIPLGRLQRQRDRILEATQRGNMEAARAAWPMFDPKTSFENTPTGALPENVGLPPYHFRCRTITVAWLGEDPAQAPEVEMGELMSEAAREAVAALSAEEHAARVSSLRDLAAAGKLAWSEAHLRQDLRKSAVRLLKHAGKDFGLDGDAGKMLADYLDIAQRTVADGETVVFQLFRDERVQYVFVAEAQGAIAIVDWETASLFGLYGHRTPGGIAAAVRERYAPRGAVIVAGSQ